MYKCTRKQKKKVGFFGNDRGNYRQESYALANIGRDGYVFSFFLAL